MPYTICYGTEKRCKKRGRNPVGKLTLCAAALLTAMQLFDPAGMQSLREWLLPGVTAETYVRLETLADALTAGEKLPEALTAFCRDVLAEETS